MRQRGREKIPLVTPLEFGWRTSGRNTSNGGTAHPANGGLTMLRKGPSRLMPCFASPSSPFIVSSSPATTGNRQQTMFLSRRNWQPAPGRPGKKRRTFAICFPIFGAILAKPHKPPHRIPSKSIVNYFSRNQSKKWNVQPTRPWVESLRRWASKRMHVVLVQVVSPVVKIPPPFLSYKMCSPDNTTPTQARCRKDSNPDCILKIGHLTAS